MPHEARESLLVLRVAATTDGIRHFKRVTHPKDGGSHLLYLESIKRFINLAPLPASLQQVTPAVSFGHTFGTPPIDGGARYQRLEFDFVEVSG